MAVKIRIIRSQVWKWRRHKLAPLEVRDSVSGVSSRFWPRRHKNSGRRNFISRAFIRSTAIGLVWQQFLARQERFSLVPHSHEWKISNCRCELVEKNVKRRESETFAMVTAKLLTQGRWSTKNSQLTIVLLLKYRNACFKLRTLSQLKT
jgi:hypothetical protein